MAFNAQVRGDAVAIDILRRQILPHRPHAISDDMPLTTTVGRYVDLCTIIIEALTVLTAVKRNLYAITDDRTYTDMMLEDLLEAVIQMPSAASRALADNTHPIYNYLVQKKIVREQEEEEEKNAIANVRQSVRDDVFQAVAEGKIDTIDWEVIAHTNHDLSISDDTCCICTESFLLDDGKPFQVTKWKKCGHFIHSKCSDKWNPADKSCPLCRSARDG